MIIEDIENTYITSDHHFRDTRFDLLYRDFPNAFAHDDFLIKNWNNIVPTNAEVIHLGDVSVDEEGYKYLEYLNGNIHLIRGNYDEPYTDEFLLQYVQSVHTNMEVEVDGHNLNLVHRPTDGRHDMFNIVGHVHSVWKVQRNMINVGIDVWNYKPINFKQLLFTMNAVQNFYDVNCFAGELECNKKIL